MRGASEAGSGSASERVDVCLAALRYYPTYAGPAIRFRRYAPGLRRRGIDLRVVSGARPDDGEAAKAHRAGELLPIEDVEGVAVRRVRLPGTRKKRKYLISYFRGLTKALTTVDPAPEVLHLLDLPFWWIPWILRLRRRGIPVVYTDTMMLDPAVTGLRKLLLLRPFEFADRIVVSSGVMRDELKEDGVRTPLEVIPNGVDLERFHPLEEDARIALRRELGLPPSGELILFVGGFLERRKGLDVLARAWKRIAPRRPRAHLVLVGPHLDAFRAEGPQRTFLEGLRAALRESGAEDRVVFTGRVEDVERYLQVCDVFVFPSRREGMPNVVPEAYACGAAAVLTPFLGLPDEFGRPGEHYVLARRTPQDLERAVVELLEDPARRRRLGCAARKWVVEELDVELSLDRYAALYRELAGKRAASDRDARLRAPADAAVAG